MKKQSIAKKFSKPSQPALSKPVLLGALGLSVILLLVMLQSQYGIFSHKLTQPPTPTLAPVPSSAPTQAMYNSPTPTPASQTFISPDLGISFNYANDPNYTATEIGKKVYIHGVKLQPTSGLSLEVFSKVPGDTIDTAIKKQFLQGIADSDCQVRVLSSLKQMVSNDEGLPSSYSVAQIIVPGYAGMDLATLEQRYHCPTPYTYTGQQGIIFFLVDSNHPNKLVFVNNGQSGISSGKLNESWYNTIRFLDTSTP